MAWPVGFHPSRFPDDAPAAWRTWIDGYVDHWLADHPLDAGAHETTLEVTSRDGRVVTYTWRFSLTEPTDRW